MRLQSPAHPALDFDSLRWLPRPGRFLLCFFPSLACRLAWIFVP
jgi:hypothetical protein